MGAEAIWGGLMKTKLFGRTSALGVGGVASVVVALGAAPVAAATPDDKAAAGIVEEVVVTAQNSIAPETILMCALAAVLWGVFGRDLWRKGKSADEQAPVAQPNRGLAFGV